MIVIAGNTELGDTICQLPALDALRQKNRDLKILFRNESVAEILPRALKEHLTWDIDGTHEIVTLNALKGVMKYGFQGHHATQLYFKMLGLEPPKEVPRPKIDYSGKAPEYDYVIAPFTNDLNQRGWDWRKWDELVIHFARQEESIAVIGGHGAPTLFQPESVHYQHYYGHRLDFVASLMKNARKAVITLDSGPSRLAHAVGCENHILLCSSVVPEEWAENPYGRMIYGPPHSFKVQHILEQIEDLSLEAKGSNA